jgi:hypothetical protein
MILNALYLVYLTSFYHGRSPNSLKILIVKLNNTHQKPARTPPHSTQTYLRSIPTWSSIANPSVSTPTPQFRAEERTPHLLPQHVLPFSPPHVPSDEISGVIVSRAGAAPLLAHVPKEGWQPALAQ